MVEHDELLLAAESRRQGNSAAAAGAPTERLSWQQRVRAQKRSSITRSLSDDDEEPLTQAIKGADRDGSKASISYYHVLRSWRGASAVPAAAGRGKAVVAEHSLILFRLWTGRRHQLRVHTASVLNVAILGDELYAPIATMGHDEQLSAQTPDTPLHLHAVRLRFPLPYIEHEGIAQEKAASRVLDVFAPLPDYFVESIERLESAATRDDAFAQPQAATTDAKRSHLLSSIRSWVDDGISAVRKVL
jgi:hypothetical protein